MMKKIAYLILAHSDPVHFGKLCNALDRDFCDIYVHIDKKCSDSAFRKAVADCKVRFLNSRVSVSWAGISMIDALNLLIKQALVNKQEYTHFVFLTGSCYPIKKTDLIYETLIYSPDTQYIKYIDMRSNPETYMKHINQKWFKEPFIPKTNLKFLKFIDKATRAALNRLRLRNQWSNHMVPYFGSTWCALTVDCCQYIMDFQDKNRWYRRMNKYTFAPDEHFYHTIIGNSKFGEFSTGQQPFEVIGLWRLANFHIIHPSLLKWYTLDDWGEIASSEKFFVRKVRSLDGETLVDRINNELLA